MNNIGYILMQAVDIFCRVLELLILARVILSWLPISRDNGLIQLLYALTEPILGPLRKLLAKSPLGGSGMPLDFSAFLAFFAIQIGRGLLLSLLSTLFR